MMHTKFLSGAIAACLFAGTAGALGANPDIKPEAKPSANPDAPPLTVTRGTRSEPTMNERIFTAAEEGDASTIARLLDEGGDVNERSRWRETKGATPIMIALERNPSRAAIELLVERGAKIDARDGQGRSLLMYAMKREHDQGVTELLIEAGAKVQARDASGQSVLMYACEFASDIGVIRRLLEHGARIDARDAEGRTPLMYAVRRELDDGAIGLLIEHGASIEERDALDRDVLMNAAAYARSGEVVDTLVDLGADIHTRLSKEALEKNTNFYTGDTVLSFACVLNPNPEILKALLRHGADINDEVVYGMYQRRKGEAGFVTRPTSHLYLIARYTQSADVLDAALDAGATHSGEDSPLEGARMNRYLIGSDAYWRLNDQSYD